MKKEKKGELIPKIKKKINAFLIGEEGKISKQALMKAGVIAGGIGTSLLFIETISALTGTHNSHYSNWPWARSQHTSTLYLTYSGNEVLNAHNSSHSNSGWNPC